MVARSHWASQFPSCRFISFSRDFRFDRHQRRPRRPQGPREQVVVDVEVGRWLVSPLPFLKRRLAEIFFIRLSPLASHPQLGRPRSGYSAAVRGSPNRAGLLLNLGWPEVANGRRLVRSRRRWPLRAFWHHLFWVPTGSRKGRFLLPINGPFFFGPVPSSSGKETPFYSLRVVERGFFSSLRRPPSPYEFE